MILASGGGDGGCDSTLVIRKLLQTQARARLQRLWSRMTRYTCRIAAILSGPGLLTSYIDCERFKTEWQVLLEEIKIFG